MKLRKIVETALIWGFIIMSGTGCGRRTVVIEEVKTRQMAAEQGTDTAADPAEAEGKAVAADRTEASKQTAENVPTIKVYVCGAVAVPGVYELPEESRICDAVEMAGGYTKDADLTGINPAQRMKDEQYIRIYTQEEVSEAELSGYLPGSQMAMNNGSSGGDGTLTQNGKINLNTASRDDLMTLPGIGETKADAILAYRQAHGAFSSVEEIMEISGIKNSVFNKIRELITV